MAVNYRDVRDSYEFLKLYEAVGNRSKAFAMLLYRRGQWADMDRGMRVLIIKSRVARPDTCPTCGKPNKLYMINRSGRELDSDDDWYWSCMSCHKLSLHNKPPGSSRELIRAKKRYESMDRHHHGRFCV